MERRRYVNPEAAVMTQPAQMTATGSGQPGIGQVAQPSVVFPWGNPKLLDPPSQPGHSPLPPYFRSTVGVFPSTHAVEESSGVSLGLIINPSLVVGAPTLDYSKDNNLCRCSRCAAYLSPYSRMMSDNRAWQCPFCNMVNPIENRYDTGFRQRTEFTSPVYDVYAPPSFHANPDMGPCFMFLIDLSFGAVSTGFTLHCLNSIKASIDSVPDTVKVGLMTMSNTVSVYDFARDTEWVVGDLSDPVVPPKAAAPLGTCRDKFKRVIDALIARSAEAGSNGHCYASALLVAEKALRGYGGIVLAFCCGYPTVGSHAIAKRQIDPNAPEHTYLQLTEANKGYKEIGFILNRSGVSVHLFNILNPEQRISELPVLGFPVTLTCGMLHFYQQLDPAALHTDIFKTLTTSYMWDSSMRLRTCVGIKTGSPLGSCTIRDKTLFYPVLAAHHSVGFVLSVDEDIKTDNALFQAAILWTNIEGRRMMRIFTFAIPTTSQPAVVKASVDEAAMTTLYMKRAGMFSTQHGPIESSKNVRKMFTSLCTGATRRESMYHLVHSLLCSPMLRSSPPNGSSDQRYCYISESRSISIIDCLLTLYPRLFAVDRSAEPLPLSDQAFSAGFIIMVHSAERIYIWLSPDTPPEVVQAFFGCTLDTLPSEVPQIETEQNKYLNDLITQCYTMSGRYLPLEIIPPGSPRESIFSEILVDMSQLCGANLTVFLSEFTASFH